MWGREDQSYKDIMSKEKGLERVWLPSPSLGAAAATWQGNFIDNGYATTHELERCDTEFRPSPSTCNRGFAAGDVANVFGNLLGRPATIRGNDLLILLGDDFAWPIADIYFDYVDGLVDALNSHPSGLFNASYATPESYVLAKLAAVPSFPATVGDFFPYADDAGGHNLWTGYFTSRPAFKGLVRDSSSYMQGARQLQLMAGGVADAGPANPLFKLERALGVAQHHDAISGTAMQRVDQDYIRILAEARADAFSSIASSLAAASGFAGWALCELHNVTHCPALEAGKPTVVFVYNSLGQADGAASVRLAVGLPAGVASYSVANASGAPVTAQLLPLSERDVELRALYNDNAPAPQGLAVQWLCFQGALPAAGFAAFFLTPAASAAGAPRTFFSARVAAAAAENTTITNGRVTLTFDPATAMVSGFSDSVTGAAAPLTQRWLVYTGADGSDLNGSRQASGAYIFRPLMQTPLPVSTEGAPPALTLFTGPVVSEARSMVGYVSQSTRLWAGAADVECEWTVGPVDRQPAGASTPLSQEVVTRYDGGWGGGGGPSAWVSDSNCREGQARRTAWRPQPQWNYSGSEPVSENYFPTGCLVRTSSPDLTLAVAVDRAQGSTSPAPGVLEVMVHRRMAHDDGRGVGEPLNVRGGAAISRSPLFLPPHPPTQPNPAPQEPGLDGNGLIIRGRHWLVVAPAAVAAPLYKFAQQRALALPNNILGFAPLGALTPSAWLAQYKGGASVLAAPLPPNVHLATLHALAPTRVLLRLAHTYDAGEHPQLAQNATVGLAGLLQGWVITEAVDYTLPGSQPLAGVPQSVLTTDDGARYMLPVLPDAPAGAQLLVTLPPMSIRTLMCTVEKR
jgi:lysosomal alpha-mannosidase